MRRVGILGAGAFALLATTASAFAADIVVIPPPAPTPPAVADARFAGPYWGVYSGIWNGAVQQRITPLVGTQFGYNFLFGNLMAGFEVETEYLRRHPTTVDATLSARFGFILGTNVLLFGQAGVGTFYAHFPYGSVGGGIEVALGSGLVLFGEAKRLWRLDGAVVPAWTIRGGINYYAGGDNLDAGGGFDWGGLYFGLLGGTQAPQGVIAFYGASVGYNFVLNNLVAGVEVETRHQGLTLNPGAEATLSGRAGVLFGNFLIYGEIGIGTNVSVPTWSWGAGIELALGDRISIFAEADRVRTLGLPLPMPQYTAGLNIHFGR